MAARVRWVACADAVRVVPPSVFPVKGVARPRPLGIQFEQFGDRSEASCVTGSPASANSTRRRPEGASVGGLNRRSARIGGGGRYGQAGGAARISMGIEASRNEVRLTRESVGAAAGFAAVLGTAASEAGASGRELARDGAGLTTQFLKDVGSLWGRTQPEPSGARSGTTSQRRRPHRPQFPLHLWGLESARST
jgi:hypothetical protein